MLLACLILLAGGCGGDEPPSRDAAFEKGLALPGLYLTAKTNKRVVAPRGQAVLVDKETGETCWPAQACYNPECPGRGPDGEPYLFITPIAGVYVKPDGTLGSGGPPQEYGPDTSGGLCPKCTAAFKLNSAPPERRQQYAAYVKTYVLPETAKKLKELAEERRKNRKSPYQ
jgi:hypothetical protein